jgi:hypothetical protein
MVKIGNQKGKTPQGKTVNYCPLEAHFQLMSFLRVELGGKEVGAMILKKPKSEALKIQFAFECRGISPLLRPEAVEPVFEALEQGLKDFPEGETLTIHLGSFTDDALRQQQLGQLVKQNSHSPELQLLLMGEQKRIQELTALGVRKTKFLRLYGSFTIGSGEETGHDSGEKLLSELENWWLKFTGVYEEVQQQKLEDILRSAFSDGFGSWEQFLATKLGLNVRSLSVEEIWSGLWWRFNQTEPRPVPQTLVLSESGLREETTTGKHPVSLLMESESSVPIADRRWVKVKDKYIGVLVFADKPGGWKDTQSQLRYLWKAIAQERVSDTEIICQLALGNPHLLKAKLNSLTKQANLTAQEAASKNGVDVNASLRFQKTIEAQEALYTGEVPLYTSVVFLVHREQVSRLDEDCKYLQSLFKRPAWLVRETEYAWKIWLETFPIHWEKMLTKPFARRVTYLTGEVPGMLPLVITRSMDKDGLELMAAEGGTPIHLDLFSLHKNLGIFGTTRSGKSVMVGGILIQGLARGLPISAMDYPKPDGTGTFSDLCQFLGVQAAYFDIGKEASNIFEPPDLRGLEPQLQQERFADYKDFLLEMLQLMVLGVVPRGDVNPDAVRSLLTIAIEKFFGDYQIQKRYGEAFQGGFGTTAWSKMPTLPDFIGFCGLERLQLINPSPELVSGLDFIKLRLRFWENSRVGKCLARVSTFPSNAPLLIVAARNLSNPEDAALVALTSNMAALRRSLAAPRSIFFLDEAPILFQFDSVAAFIAKLCANGAKSGIRVILSAQEPDTIMQSQHGSKVLANLGTRLIGRIQPTTIDSYIRYFKYPPEVIGRNATEAYFPSSEWLYSQWLVDDGGDLAHTRYYSPPVLLAAVANNPEEAAARQQAMAEHGDKLQGLVHFSRQYSS